MADVLRCIDPRGLIIFLSDDRWNSHIIPGHGEMTGNEDAVFRTLIEPLFIVRDKQRNAVENYYRPFVLPPPFMQFYSKVCVRFREDPLSHALTGEVLTAFATDATQEGEVEVWPDQN